MNARSWLAALTLSLMGGTAVLAQAIPSAPPAPAAPTAAAPVTTVWEKLGLTKENCQACKDACCKSPLGQMLNNMTKPLTLGTGGLIGPLCPTAPSDEELKKILGPNSNASEAEKTAAQIKADEAKAAARRGAIRYLGTVDCHYYPEAEDALISGLRGDRNECVRFEAALALSKGCCCTKKTLAALLVVVDGSDSDGNPSETSERVKQLSMVALQRCMYRVPDRPQQPERPPDLVPPEKVGMAGKSTGGVQLTAYYTQQVPRISTQQMIDHASRLIAESVSTSLSTRMLPTGQKNLSNIVAGLSAPTSIPDAMEFDLAVLTLPELRVPPVQTPPPAPPAQQSQPLPPRVESPRPVMLTAPGAVLNP